MSYPFELSIQIKAESDEKLSAQALRQKVQDLLDRGSIKDAFSEIGIDLVSCAAKVIVVIK